MKRLSIFLVLLLVILLCSCSHGENVSNIDNQNELFETTLSQKLCGMKNGKRLYANTRYKQNAIGANGCVWIGEKEDDIFKNIFYDDGTRYIVITNKNTNEKYLEIECDWEIDNNKNLICKATKIDGMVIKDTESDENINTSKFIEDFFSLKDYNELKIENCWSINDDKLFLGEPPIEKLEKLDFMESN